MASKTTLNAKNLEALGAPALAELLMDISTGSAPAKRRLRLALAGEQGPKEAAVEIAKRLAAIARARTMVTWKRRKALAVDLQTQLAAILQQVAPGDRAMAVDLLWRFLGLANSVFDRCDDSSGTIIGIFHEACAQLGEVALDAALPSEGFTGQMLDALLDNGYGQYDELIPLLAPALGKTGLQHLKLRVTALSASPIAVPAKDEWEKVGYGSGGAVYAHDVMERNRISTVDLALRQIADAQGDADAFIARYPADTRRVPKVAAEIAIRLMAAGRAQEALDFLDRAEVDEARWVPVEWQDARIDALEALGKTDEAQAFRWHCFTRALSAPHLRGHLKRLPDFDDIEAEDRAMDYASAFPHALLSLSFFMNWPAHDHAAKLILSRHAELDGDHFEILTLAAETLAERYPLAAILVLRAMIDFALTKARPGRYAHIARHLVECAELDARVEDYGSIAPHASFAAWVSDNHSRKTSFWVEVARLEAGFTRR
ncbi:MAG: hypothetical protein ACJASV_001132 [Pseudorhodobacter sp.]|jgi:hypothetical protein